VHGPRLSYAALVALLLAGVVCLLLLDGTTGQALGGGLISFAALGAVLMFFFEIGLGEDRARQAEDRADEPPARRLRAPLRRRR
jgi:hypothetical protein